MLARSLPARVPLFRLRGYGAWGALSRLDKDDRDVEKQHNRDYRFTRIDNTDRSMPDDRLDRESWAWAVLPAVLMGVIAYVGESRLHDKPDWVILAVAIGAGLVVALLLRVARAVARASRH
jgi:hypothetical protein